MNNIKIMLQNARDYVVNNRKVLLIAILCMTCIVAAVKISQVKSRKPVVIPSTRSQVEQGFTANDAKNMRKEAFYRNVDSLYNFVIRTVKIQSAQGSRSAKVIMPRYSIEENGDEIVNNVEYRLKKHGFRVDRLPTRYRTLSLLISW